MERLDGKTALVRVIGPATAEIFRTEGARVIATAINETSLLGIAQGDGIEPRVLEVMELGIERQAGHRQTVRASE